MKFDTDYLLGEQTGCFVGFATDEQVRHRAASGGVVSAITRYLLDKQLVAGVLASRIIVRDNEVTYESIVARTSDELDSCKNSIYMDFPLPGEGRFKSLIHELQTTNHRFAVVGLFCHLKALTAMLEKNGIARDRVIMIGLFCSHAPEPRLLHQVLDKVGVDFTQLAEYHTKTGEGYRDGRIYGQSTVVYKDGSEMSFPFIRFTTYKNAFFYTHDKCLQCPDQFCEVADISCGDAWYKDIRKHPYKQTTVVTRTEEARELMLRMVADSAVELRYVDPRSVVHSQRRVAGLAKASLAARTRLASFFGIRLRRVEGQARLIDYLHSFLLLFNVWLSRSRRWEWVIFAIPEKLMLAYVLFLKVVENGLLPGLPKGDGVGEYVEGTPDSIKESASQQSPHKSAA